MGISPRGAIAAAALAGAAAGIAYTVFALGRIRAFDRDRSRAPAPALQPPITVLKPLHGNEPQLEENLRSFCDQDYGEFQIVFGAADEDDPSLGVARRVAAEFPERDIHIVAGTGGRDARNPKIANLLGMLPFAKHDILAIADSDIRAGRSYLQHLAACFASGRTGAATCLYGAVPSDESLASRLGAAYVNEQFAPSVLVAAAIEPLSYTFGATMAVRREALARSGGLEALADDVGDDYLLGKRVASAGYAVALCPYLVHTTVSESGIAGLWHHELRWARTIRASRPSGYAGSVVTFPLAWAALYALAARGAPFSLAVLGTAAAARLALHAQARATFAPQLADEPWLVPLREAFGVAVWVASFFGDRVLWKDRELRVMHKEIAQRDGSSLP